ncbi:hypothetical protein ACRAQ7_04980 [Erythrobacter sp. W53]|uniref:hypothetical protein n=1 Tax=Erythrobacter sp. W53 TaxID=3425947 RepID=UPI003D76A3D4
MLSIEVDLPIEKGALSNLAELQKRLVNVDDRRCKALNNRIKRWSSHRPLRHLLAHATLIELTDNSGEPVVVTRHLPRDKDDVTPDRLWSLAEQAEVLRQASSDSRSIADQVRNLTTDSALMAKLRAG